MFDDCLPFYSIAINFDVFCIESVVINAISCDPGSDLILHDLGDLDLAEQCRPVVWGEDFLFNQY